MKYEVEQKFPVADLNEVAARLVGLGVKVGEPVVQVDRYFAHPERDFASTDEALRIRSAGSENCITYKGPKINATTKTRHEIELPLAPGSGRADQYTELLGMLSFERVADVRKTRRKATLVWQNIPVEIALDEVDRVGTFVELETAADAQSLEEAIRCLKDLADNLSLHNSERRSYLELLLER